MRYLLDTHVFLCAIAADRRLSENHRTLYEDGSAELCLSVASLWEILIRIRLGKLELPQPATAYLLRQMEMNRVTMLPLRATHFMRLEELAPIHRDPFDRMLVAQAQAEGIPIMTSDDAIRQYNVEI